MMKVFSRGTRIAGAGVLLLTLGGCGGLAGSSEGDSAFGNEPIEYVIPYGPGGGTDPVGREFSRMLAEELGTRAVVTNMPGGDTAIGVGHIVNSTPDGHTIGLSSTGGAIIQPIINPDLAYASEDFEVLAKMTEAPNAILVGKDSPYETLDDLLEDARERPGEVRVGGPGTYISTGFAAVSLEEQADVEFTLVPFSGGAGEAALGAMSNEVDAVVVTAAAQLGLIESGDLKALAYTGSNAYADVLPGAVSLEDAGYDIPFPSDYMTLIPAGIPEEIRAELFAAAEAVTNSEEWAAWCEEQGYLATPLAETEVKEWFDDVVTSTEEVIATLEAREQ